jgi:hypothetical protein
MIKVSYKAFLQTITRYFTTIENAHHWIAKVGIGGNYSLKIERIG